MPKLSIITINYNNASGLKKTLESVWAKQSFTDFEHIVIDGGSNDDSVTVIKEYAEKLSYWVSEPDNGIYNAMNKGIAKAQGEYFLFINSGDWLCDDILKDIFEFDFNEDIVSGNYINVCEDGKTFITQSPEEVTLAYFMLHSIGHPSTLIRGRLLKENPYNEHYKIVSDWAFWVEELIIKNRSYRKVPITVSNFCLGGISDGEDARSIINEETRDFFTKTFGKRFVIDTMYDYVKAIDVISKHNPDAILYSMKRQRKLRKYNKFLDFLGK